jgi:16S rRNA (guanine1207-N2)-methyltransferase
VTDFPFDQLRRWPDFEAPELVAADAADRLIVSTASEWCEARAEAPLASQPPIVSVIGDAYGAITLGMLSALGSRYGTTDSPVVRVHQDARAGELALDNNSALIHVAGYSRHDLGPELVTGAQLVLVRLPRSLDQLDEWASLIAAYASEELVVLAGGRDKYMTPSMNEVLSRYFDEVSTGRGSQKSRVISARQPKQANALGALAEWPSHTTDPDFGLEIRAHGGVFAGGSVDIGTRTLLEVLDRVPGTQNQRILDFGCGTGLLAVQVARLRPTAQVIATDQSAAAALSARATVEANRVGDRVTVVRDDGLSSQPDGSADLILFNPPFHSGAAVHADTSLRLFAEAGRVLKPGGELWVVANRHLSYRPALRRLVGSTRLIIQNPKFTVTASVKDGGARDQERFARRRDKLPRGLPNERWTR